MLRRVALARTDFSEACNTSAISLTRIGEIGTSLAVTSNYYIFLRSVPLLLVTANVIPISQILATLMMEALGSSETSVLTTAIRRPIPKYGILHSHRLENLKSYMALTGWALYWRGNVLPVRYELGLYIPDDGILHSHGRENFKSYSIL
jgi:hypothetical protein